jgi:hypothetical protein
MRVLWLGKSEDIRTELPDEERYITVALRTFEELTGEHPEATVHRIWPKPNLPDLVEGWMRELQPEFGAVRLNPFWYDYETVQRGAQGRFRRAGPIISSAADRLTRNPRVRNSSPLRLLRKAAGRATGRRAEFTTDEVLTRTETALRRILKHEDVGLVVLASDGGRVYQLEPWSRSEELQQYVDAGMRKLCESLHVPYRVRRHYTREELRPMVLPDELHLNAHGAKIVGEADGRLVAEAWLAHTGKAKDGQ